MKTDKQLVKTLREANDAWKAENDKLKDILRHVMSHATPEHVKYKWKKRERGFDIKRIHSRAVVPHQVLSRILSALGGVIQYKISVTCPRTKKIRKRLKIS